MTGFTFHNPDDVPEAVGDYTNALEVPAGHRTLFISGQIPETRDGVVPDDVAEQCRLIWQHIESCLRSADMTISNVVKVTTYLSDHSVADANTRVRREVLGEHRPALTVIVADIFAPQWNLEIDVIAAAPAI